MKIEKPQFQRKKNIKRAFHYLKVDEAMVRVVEYRPR